MKANKRRAWTTDDIAYGAWAELEKHGGFRLRRELTPRGLHWQHGWLPAYHNTDPDLIIGEDGRARVQKSDAFLVARLDQEKSLKGFGFPAVKAIGLPFNYALLNVQAETTRRRDSLLIMPGGHTTDEVEFANFKSDSNYINFLKTLIKDYKYVSVVLHARDIRLGRQMAWEAAGLEVVLGAGYGDVASLNRIARLFKSAECVSTNGLGSHIVYAAAAGCRVSLAGPPPEPTRAPEQTFFRNRPDLVSTIYQRNLLCSEELGKQGICCSPSDASTHIDWANQQIGSGNILRPETVEPTLRHIARFPRASRGSLFKNLPYVFRISRRLGGVFGLT